MRVQLKKHIITVRVKEIKRYTEDTLNGILKYTGDADWDVGGAGSAKKNFSGRRTRSRHSNSRS